MSDSKGVRKTTHRKFTPDQIQQIHAEYPTMPTKDLATKMGLSWKNLTLLARRIGLFKSPEYLREVRRASALSAASKRVPRPAKPPKPPKISAAVLTKNRRKWTTHGWLEKTKTGFIHHMADGEK